LNFSVLISLYCKVDEKQLEFALNSLFTQSLVPNQVVVVLDGPVPMQIIDTLNYFKSQNFTELTLIKLEKNSGLGIALAEGLKYCNYDLVARMDADDIAEPNRFQKQIEFMTQNPNVSVLGTNVWEFKMETGDLNIFKHVPLSHKAIFSYSKYRNPLNHPSVVFRKTHVLESGSYQNMPFFEDYFLWVRMLKLGYQFQNLDESLLNFRIGDSMVGRRHGFQYLIHELRFLNTIRALKHISRTEYFLNIILKLPLRIIPIRLLKIIYRLFLR
jgi:glycosyltransferase involved in cell wall biosynthesis